MDYSSIIGFIECVVEKRGDSLILLIMIRSYRSYEEVYGGAGGGVGLLLKRHAAAGCKMVMICDPEGHFTFTGILQGEKLAACRLPFFLLQPSVVKPQ